jgi:phosphoribosylformimino-5-aminoimidazole carboxamide ribotide isomerase
MLLFPAIDLREGRVVRLHQGDYAQEKSYAADPLDQARAFAAAGAQWLHVVDLDGARSGGMTQLHVIERLCQGTKLNVEVGGGVRSTETIDSLLSLGVARVILGTAALANWPWFEALARDAKYRGRLVLGLDARGGMLAVKGWEQQTQTRAVDVAQKISDWPVAAIIYTDIATDGTLQGPNLDATAELARTTRVPIIASGGVGTLDHLRALARLPLAGVIVGKALYEGKFTAAEALAALDHAPINTGH